MAKKNIIPEDNTPQPTPVIPAAQQEYVDKVTQQNANATAQSAGLQQQTGPASPEITPPVQAISGTDKQTPAPAAVQVKTPAPALEVAPVAGSLKDPTNPKSPFYGMTQEEINNQLAANDPYFSGIQKSVDSNAPIQPQTPTLNVPGANDNQASPTAAAATLQSGAGAPLYDPNNPVNVFERYAPRPTQEMDAERQAALRNGAAISDSFAALADMFAHGKGAYVRPRDTTAMQTADARIEAGTQKDRERSDAYKNALLNVAMNDYEFKRKAALENEQLVAKLTNQRAIADAQNKLKLLDLKIQKGHYTNQDLLERDKLDADIKDMQQKNDQEVAKQKETGRHNKEQESIDWYKAKHEHDVEWYNAKTKNDKVPSVQAYIGGKPYMITNNDMMSVVSRAIKDGVVTIKQEVNDPISGKKIGYTNVKVTPTTELKPEQIRQIYEANYSRYLDVSPNGAVTIRQHLTPYDKKTGTTAFDKNRGGYQPEQNNNNPSAPTSTDKWY